MSESIPGQPSAVIHPLTRARLPIAATSLIGREREVERARRLLERADVPLLTLIGPGGVGKTRLALRIASEMLSDFSDGVFFVALAAIRDPELIAGEIARALELEDDRRPSLVVLKNFAHQRQILLVLDNFEQVLEAAPIVAELLGVAPHLKVLVTSRTPLRLSGEHEFAVPPLELPGPHDSKERSGQRESIRLFVERARALQPDFALGPENLAAVTEIVRRLDGLPLALELAAARIKLLGPHALADRLEHRLRLLTGGARDLPERQQTIRATIDWSFELLEPAEQTLFARLGVFAGGWTLPALEAVCNPNGGLDALEGLSSLVNKSLVRRLETDGEPRFAMLETIREYALVELERRGELEAARQHHAEFYRALAERPIPEQTGIKSAQLAELEAGHDNLRLALGRLIASDEREAAVRMSIALGEFWQIHDHLREGLSLLEAAFGQGDGMPIKLRADALTAQGLLAYRLHDLRLAEQHFEAGLALRQQISDEHGITDSLMHLGNVATGRAEYPRAQALFEQAIDSIRPDENPAQLGKALLNLGTVHFWQVDFAAARSRVTEALGLYRKMSHEVGLAHALNNLGVVAEYQGKFEEARAYYEESLAFNRALGHRRGLADLELNLGNLARQMGDVERATEHYERGLALAREINYDICAVNLLVGLGTAAGQGGDHELDLRLSSEALTIARRLGRPDLIAMALQGVSGALIELGQVEPAAVLVGEASATFEAHSLKLRPDQRRGLEDVSRSARMVLGQARFTAALEQGRARVAAPSAPPATSPTAPRTRNTLTDLTPRELEVLRQVALGLTNAQIAEGMGISRPTVSTHLRTIFSKLNLSTRSAATRYALEHGLA